MSRVIIPFVQPPLDLSVTDLFGAELTVAAVRGGRIIVRFGQRERDTDTCDERHLNTRLAREVVDNLRAAIMLAEML